MKTEPIHFSSHNRQVSSADMAISSSSSLWYIFPPTIPQNLHEQYTQCQSPEGNFCEKKKKIDVSSDMFVPIYM